MASAALTPAQRIGYALGVSLPLAGLVCAVVLLWDRFVGPGVLTITAVMYAVSGVGITVGFHRLLAHRSFEAGAAVRALLAVLGSMAAQGAVIKWVSNHRMHHAFSDEEGDPHSPHLSGRRGVWGALGGLWHAHVGWIVSGDRALPERYAPDLLADRILRVIDRTFLLWVALGLIVPFLAGLGMAGTVEGGLLAVLWGGFVRIFLLQHMTFAINSLCHFVGRRRFPTRDHSRNLVWLAPLSFGEAWHNNHHAFPSSAFHGLRRREIDPGGWVIRLLERLHLASNVKRISPERQAARRVK